VPALTDHLFRIPTALIWNEIQRLWWSRLPRLEHRFAQTNTKWSDPVAGRAYLVLITQDAIAPKKSPAIRPGFPS
jgi:hypothetical protein